MFYGLYLSLYGFIKFKSLATNRGRAIMMTTAFAFIAERGPIRTIEKNVDQIVDSVTCMYTQVNTLNDLLVWIYLII